MNTKPISNRLYLKIVAGVIVWQYPSWSNLQFDLYRNNVPRPERTIIVTGATGTLGHATTRELAKRKCRIIMACRDMEKCKSIRRDIVLSTKNNGIACRHLDLEDIDSINRFADQMIEEEPHVDVLINMAAVKELKNRELTKYGIEKHYFVNFLAPYLLTLKLMPKLEESAKETLDSRVVNVIGSPKKSWHLDLTDINFDKRKYKNKDAYRQSKLALAYFSILLEKFNRLKKNSVYVFGTSPRTTRIAPVTDHDTSHWGELQRGLSQFLKHPAIAVCQRNVYCALDKDLVKEGLSGRNYNWFKSSFGWNHGWGIAAMNESKAMLTWNLAADWLVNVRVLENAKPEGGEGSAEEKGPDEPAAQLNAQGNNKPSGVDVSV